MKAIAVLSLCASLWVACTIERAEVRRPPARSPRVATAEDSANVRAVILTLAREVERGDLVALEGIFDPNVVVFESGRVNRGWADYRDHHLAPELAAFTERTLRFANLDLRISNGIASVACDFQFDGRSAEGPISVSGVATFLLERTAGVWRIVHLHTSTAPVSPGSR